MKPSPCPLRFRSFPISGKKPLCHTSAIFLAFTALSHGAALTWDTVEGDGAVSTAGSGTWDLSGMGWNDGVTPNVPWTQASSTAATNTAIFGGASGTYAVTVAADIASGTLQFASSGYTLSAASAQTIRLNNSGSSIAPSLIFNSGVTATIGANVTVQQGGTAFFGSASSGGTLIIENAGTYQETAANTFAMAGAGTLVSVKTGGTLRMTATGGGAFVIGANTGDSSTLEVAGGSVSLAGSSTQFILASGTGSLSGTLTIKNGGTVSQAANTSRALTLGSNAGNIGTVNLGSGTLSVRQVVQGAGTGIFNFDGGTLKAVSSASASTFMTGLNSANVKAGGAAFDTNNFNLTVGQALLHDAGLGATADGGLTKSNTGTLTLSGVSTYTGKTTISGGTLALAAGGSINNSNELSLGTAGTFDVSAKSGGYSVSKLSGSGTVIGALTVSTQLAIGNSAGTASFGNLTVGSGATHVYEVVGGTTGTGSADLGNVGGTLDLSGAILDLVQLGTFTPGDKFTLFGYNTISGTFAGLADGAQFNDGGGNAWVIDYNDTVGTNGGVGATANNFVTVTAVPEPGAMLLGALGILALLRRRKD